jgi:hypothetical protein
MSLLTSLTPAETLWLSAPKMAPLSRLAKATFDDLVYRDILRFQPSVTPIITRGNLFSAHLPLPHESPFLDVFTRQDRTEIPLKEMMRSVRKTLYNRKEYTNLIRKSPQLQGLWRDHFGSRWLGMEPPLTEAGQERHQLVKEALGELGQMLPALMQSNPSAAREQLAAIGANALLVQGITWGDLVALDPRIRERLGQAPSSFESDFRSARDTTGESDGSQFPLHGNVPSSTGGFMPLDNGHGDQGWGHFGTDSSAFDVFDSYSSDGGFDGDSGGDSSDGGGGGGD